LENLAAFLAQAQEFDVVVLDEEIVFFRQSFLCFFHQVQLFLKKITVVNNPAALRADEMMVVVVLAPLIKFVATLAVSRCYSMDKPESVEQLQSAIDCGQTYTGILAKDRGMDFLCAYMAGGAAQEVENDFPGDGPASTMFSKPMVPLMMSRQSVTSYR
jgi:hypothetical protein